MKCKPGTCSPCDEARRRDALKDRPPLDPAPDPGLEAVARECVYEMTGSNICADNPTNRAPILRALERVREEGRRAPDPERAALVAEVERLRPLVEHERSNPNCGTCRGCIQADLAIARMAIKLHEERTTALVAAGDALDCHIRVTTGNNFDCQIAWRKLAHPEREGGEACSECASEPLMDGEARESWHRVGHPRPAGGWPKHGEEEKP